MARPVVTTFPPEWTAADWQEHLGGVPLGRIRMYPRPGLAVPHDVLEMHEKTGRLCELVDGVLVEKPIGFHESQLAGAMLFFLWAYLRVNRVGTAAGADGMLEILPNLVRMPDVSLIRWERMPAGDPGPIPAIAPDLAIEILSPSNTPAEMERKLREYFAAGARLVWYIDPTTRTARAYSGPDAGALVPEDGALSGGAVLPGFELPLRDLFAAVERPTA
jgi:Uma2 family endonuclease